MSELLSRYVFRSDTLPILEFGRAITEKHDTIETKKRIRRIQKIIEEESAPQSKRDKPKIKSKHEAYE